MSSDQQDLAKALDEFFAACRKAWGIDAAVNWVSRVYERLTEEPQHKNWGSR